MTNANSFFKDHLELLRKENIMSIFSFFKHANRKRIAIQRKFVFSLQKAIIKPQKNSMPFSSTDIKNICIINGNGIGDAIVHSGLLRQLIQSGIEISICSAAKSLTFYNDVLKIDTTYTAKEILEQKHLYDALLITKDNVDYKDGLEILKLYKHSHAKYIIGFGNQVGINDISLPPHLDSHVTCRLCEILKLFNIHNQDLSYKIEIHESHEKQVIEFLKQFTNKTVICINPFTSNVERDLTQKQIAELIKYIQQFDDVVIILLGIQNQLKSLEHLVSDNVLLTPREFSNITYSIALVKHCDLVITTDTSIVHVASAFKKKMICFYNNKITSAGAENNIYWGPNYGCVQLFTKSNYKTVVGDPMSEFDITESFKYVRQYLKSSLN